MIAFRENIREIVGVVGNFPCRDATCVGVVEVSENNSVPMIDHRGLSEVYPCLVCGLMHTEEGAHIHDQENSLGSYWIDNNIFNKSIEKIRA